jgi:hypothetical protein
MTEPAQWWAYEPTISEILSDPIVRALMDADGVDPGELEAALRSVAANRAPPQSARTARRSGSLAG